MTKTILERFFGSKTARDPPPVRVAEPGAPHATGPSAAIQLLVGVDFGTAFTKVAFRHFGGVRTGVLPVGTGKDLMAPSVIWLDSAGELSLTQTASARAERMLKMRLASGASEDGDPDEVAAMSAFFVGSMLRRAMASAGKLFPGRNLELYEAAVGCPAEYVDDGRVTRFQHMTDAAWRWAHAEDAPTSLAGMMVFMAEPRRDSLVGSCEARAEVAAAVDSFTMRPDSEAGRYVFLDVGAGTLDGACFVLYRQDRRTHVSVLATAVRPLGVAKLAENAALECGGDAQDLEARLIEASNLDEAVWRKSNNAVGGFIGELMLAAKRKDSVSNWLMARYPRPRAWTSCEERIDMARRLPVFFGGGGSPCPLYRAAAERAGGDLERNWDFPRLTLGEAVAPEGFEGLGAARFHRFAVAYGLTRPFGDPTWILPHQIKEAEPKGPKPVTDSLGVDYLSGKDAYE